MCMDNVLYVESFENGEGTLQLALPTSLRQPVLEALHDGSGHQGRDRTLALVRKRAFWPGMSTDVNLYCASCSRCCMAKALRPTVKPSMGHLLAEKQTDRCLQQIHCGNSNKRSKSIYGSEDFDSRLVLSVWGP